MTSDSVSSQDKLDQMLHDDKITDEDYVRLSKAMANKPLAQEEIVPEPDVKRKLCKSWNHRLMGGVCGGIAEHLGIDPFHIRFIFLLACLLFAPAMVVVYFVLSFVLPWDDAKAAEEFQCQGHPWRFAAWSAFFLTLLPFAFSQFMLPSIMDVYKSFGTALPAITQIAIWVGISYRIDPYSGYIPVGGLLSLVLVVVASLSYLVCHNKIIRSFYTALFFTLAIGWTLFISVGSILGTYLGLSHM